MHIEWHYIIIIIYYLLCISYLWGFEREHNEMRNVRRRRIYIKRCTLRHYDTELSIIFKIFTITHVPESKHSTITEVYKYEF